MSPFETAYSLIVDKKAAPLVRTISVDLTNKELGGRQDIIAREASKWLPYGGVFFSEVSRGGDGTVLFYFNPTTVGEKQAKRIVRLFLARVERTAEVLDASNATARTRGPQPSDIIEDVDPDTKEQPMPADIPLNRSAMTRPDPDHPARLLEDFVLPTGVAEVTITRSRTSLERETVETIITLRREQDS